MKYVNKQNRLFLINFMEMLRPKKSLQIKD
ncbi:MAG: hypothetical protein UZ11_BCD004000353 [Bacteroidetes bacterium OLB11]|nr:MAG: hypothetical protein UZ11_BCD004000353 [Bacteroidetes bacterium OLB11]